MTKKSIFIILSFFINTVVFAQVSDIKSFLDQCPTNDPAIDTILMDFEIRLNGELVSEFPCTEPVSSMDTVDYTNPLIYLQTLRVLYYMGRDTSVHLPWSGKTLYDWFKGAVDGINIVDGINGGYCCSIIDGKTFFVTGNANGMNREFDKKWIGIAGNIDFFAHEARHTDPEAPGHTSCCGITNGCDQEYNEDNLGAYGIQYWLQKNWLTGYINVGARTSHSETEIDEIINFHLSALNDQFRNRFCENIPAIIDIEDIDTPLGPASTDIENIDLNSKLKVYPNPIHSGQELILNMLNIYSAEIYNLNGLLIKTQINSGFSSSLKIMTTNIPHGCYFIKIQDRDNKVFVEKLIIIK